MQDTRWTAVLARDARANGLFVYGVRSTGIYCRPSCPSRRPARDRVRFFDTADAAEREGYRPCKRCHPREATLRDPWIERVGRACQFLSRAEGAPTLGVLARRLGTSPYHLHRNFKRLVGLTPRGFALACRQRTVRRGLRTGESVLGALLDAGYGSSSRFYERAAARLGMPPMRYRQGGDGAAITYGVVACPFGRLLVAATARGVCSVALGDSDQTLVAGLRAEFPGAAVEPDAGSLAAWTDRAVAHLAGATPRLELPLDIRVTAFEWQVWNHLMSIPPGQTRTYAQVAAGIGKPTAARAVARACSANPVALVIPCHRVVAARGGTGGYRWGAARKAALLAAEARSKPR